MLRMIAVILFGTMAVVGVSACQEPVTCKGNVVKRIPNSDGTVSLRVHKSAGNAETDFCTAANLKATTIRRCDVGSNYPQCAG